MGQRNKEVVCHEIGNGNDVGLIPGLLKPNKVLARLCLKTLGIKTRGNRKRLDAGRRAYET